MNAFMSVIKSSVNGKITVLLSDIAHLKTSSLKHQNDDEKALMHNKLKAQNLISRYQDYFVSCNIVYWHSYICNDNNYLNAKKFVENLYQSNLIFKDCLLEDANASYSIERSYEFENKQLFIDKTIEDIIEQCACQIVLSRKGYRFLFYPGSSHTSLDYLSQYLHPQEDQISWVNVFLSIEKKTLL